MEDIIDIICMLMLEVKVWPSELWGVWLTQKLVKNGYYYKWHVAIQLGCQPLTKRKAERQIMGNTRSGGCHSDGYLINLLLFCRSRRSCSCHCVPLKRQSEYDNWDHITCWWRISFLIVHLLKIYFLVVLLRNGTRTSILLFIEWSTAMLLEIELQNRP